MAIVVYSHDLRSKALAILQMNPASGSDARFAPNATATDQIQLDAK
jgi:hypothetical protein